MTDRLLKCLCRSFFFAVIESDLHSERTGSDVLGRQLNGWGRKAEERTDRVGSAVSTRIVT